MTKGYLDSKRFGADVEISLKVLREMLSTSLAKLCSNTLSDLLTSLGIGKF